MAPCNVHDVCVVRKQFYISEEHERALKARARELGVSPRPSWFGGCWTVCCLTEREGEVLPGQALRRHWRVSCRRPTGWRSPTASQKATVSTGPSSTTTVREDAVGDGRPLPGVD